MFKKVVSIILFVLSGLFIYSAGLMLFLSFESSKVNIDLSSKISISLFYLVLAAIPLLIGLKIRKFINWKQILGIIFTSSAGVASFSFLSVVNTFSNPKYQEIMAKQMENYEYIKNISFDYISGIAYVLIIGGIGLFLLLKSKKKAK